ncbi:MAG: DUF4301 family protein [Bacteroidales bacterium]|nr:DUF4301 family protein [Bacteroidales bacterium]
MDKTTMNAQIERFRKGFPWLKIVAPATPERGIEVLDETQQDEAVKYADEAEVHGRCKFVPASGAASRMFKDIFAGLEQPNASTEKLAANLEKFAFYSPDVFGTAPFDPAATARKLLTDAGLAYGSKPKGVLRFHRYADGTTRTALAEHFVEGQAYMRNADGSVDLVVTISPEHRALFEAAVEEIRAEYEQRYGVRYNISFTYQSKDTDTLAVDAKGKPFLKDDGQILTRPAGHGALIYNLNALDAELVSIKNIDNVCVERMQPTTYRWKKVLMGRALELRDRIFGYIFALDQLTQMRKKMSDISYIPVYNMNQDDPFATPECQDLCNEIETFLHDELCIEIPEPKDSRDRAELLRAKLDRPIRVCGMVKNLGEPGGGPFIIREKDGSTSLQILEGAQINPDDPQAVAALKSATHFNPVDLVCCLRRHDGTRFNLLDYVDEETGLISGKSYQGRELKALELPGLWNGSMSDWNTLFVEVPIETFNPVKVVLDLLREAHQ